MLKNEKEFRKELGGRSSMEDYILQGQTTDGEAPKFIQAFMYAANR